MTFDSVYSRFSFANMVSDTGYHSRMYQGLNKLKTLSYILGGNSLSFSQERYMFESFDRIYFIDTNDLLIKGKRNCCTAVFEVIDHKNLLAQIPYMGGIDVKFLIGYYIFDVSSGISGEKIGWHLFIENIKPFIEKLQRENKKLLLVSDHALGDHEAFNRRTKPYYGDCYLPPNMTLGYAKSDKGESFAEKGLKIADRMANVIKESIRFDVSKPLVILKLENSLGYRGFIQVR